MKRYLSLLLATASLSGVLGGAAHSATSAYACIDGVPPCPSAPGTAPATSPPVLVSVYFAALQRGMATGDSSPLTALFTAQATVTRNDPNGSTTTARGRAQIERMYRQLFATRTQVRWFQDNVHRLSSTIILTYEHAAGPHHRNPKRSLSLFLIRSGKIVRLDETTYATG